MDDIHPADYIVYRIVGNTVIATCEVHGMLTDMSTSNLNYHGKHSTEWQRHHAIDNIQPTVFTEPEPLPELEATYEASLDKWRNHYRAKSMVRHDD